MKDEHASTTPSKAVTVYCASSANAPKSMLDAAYRLGQLAAANGIATVTGAGATGLMAAVIDGTLDANGCSIGVIPQFMIDRGWCNQRLTDLRITTDMHSRKQLLASLSSGAIALPGGPGTIEELMELMTWRQLGLHSGRLVICNLGGYYDPLLSQLQQAEEHNLMRQTTTTGIDIYNVATTVEQALDIIFRHNNA